MATIAVLDYFLTLEDEVCGVHEGLFGNSEALVHRSTMSGKSERHGRFTRSFWSAGVSIKRWLCVLTDPPKHLQNRYSLLVFVLWQQLGQCSIHNDPLF